MIRSSFVVAVAVAAVVAIAIAVAVVAVVAGRWSSCLVHRISANPGKPSSG